MTNNYFSADITKIYEFGKELDKKDSDILLDYIDEITAIEYRGKLKYLSLVSSKMWNITKDGRTVFESTPNGVRFGSNIDVDDLFNLLKSLRRKREINKII